jgi:hypothetical protein
MQARQGTISFSANIDGSDDRFASIQEKIAERFCIEQ